MLHTLFFQLSFSGCR